MEPGVRRLRVNTPVNLAQMAKSDSIVEMIQVHVYLEDVPDIGEEILEGIHFIMVIPIMYSDPKQMEIIEKGIKIIE